MNKAAARLDEKGADSQVVPPKKDPPGIRSAVTELLGAETEGISDKRQLDLIESRLQDQKAVKRSKLNPAVSQVIESSLEQLSRCPEFADHVREHLEPVILSTILFLARCMDIQKGDESRRTAYLFKPDAKEQDLQDDLIDWFRGNEHGNPIIEPQDIGGGRAELVFIFNGYRFVIELKREQNDASKESLRKYLPQATAYQTTSIPVGNGWWCSTSPQERSQHSCATTFG